MKCPHCSHENPEGAKFCMNCGQGTALKCPSCSAEVPPKAKFCLECGHKIETTAAKDPAKDRLEQYIPRELMKKLDAARKGGGMRGERRVVTMLFCDVQGSTAAAEQLDPEDWAEIMNGAFEHLIAPVYRYEGTLARLMGDAVLAFFGAPIAHEDDPQRAVFAGLAIVREIEPYCARVKQKWGIDFQVRVGINTGLVVVGEVGTDMRLEYTAMGDAVNLASRMESTADPGTVQISEHTHKLIEPLFEFEDVGQIEVKGKEATVGALRVLGAKAKPGRLRGIDGLDSPMIGRDRELAAIRGQVDAVRRGSGAVVGVVAEAGLGKSRLVAELRTALDNEGVLSEVAWCEGRSLSYQTSTPFASVADMLGGCLDVPAEGSDMDRYAAVEKAVAAIDPGRAPDIAPYLANVLGLKLDGEPAEKVRYLEPPALRTEVENAILDYFELLAQKRPVVLVFEDLHWADSASLDIANKLMPLCDRTSIMLIGIFRPRQQEASWKFHETGSRDYAHRYLGLFLERLNLDQARALVSNLLYVEGLTDQIRNLILEKAEGNPFFVEEVIRSLLDAGIVVQDGDTFRATAEIDSLKVPDSLAAVLNARLDSLDDNTKGVAQTASVLGREFEFDLLASVYEPLKAVNDALTALQRRGLVREKARIPKRLYSFKHVMTQETAYGSLLLKTRRQLHAQVADVLGRIEPDRVNDIAHHYLEARENAKALPHLVEAGDRAAKAYSTPEAIGYYEKALSILETGVGDATLGRCAFEGLGNARQLVADLDGALATYQNMRAYAKQHGDGSMEVSAVNKLGMIQSLFLGDYAGGLALLDEAQKLADDVGCRAGLAEGCMIRCGIYTSQGDFDNAFAYNDKAAELGAAIEAEEPMLYGMTHLSNTMVMMTEYERAWDQIQETLAKARELGNKKWESDLLSFSVPMYLMREGRFEEAMGECQKGVEIAESIGHAAAVGGGAALLGIVATMGGYFEDGIALNEKALAAASASGLPFLKAMALCTLGTSYLEVSERLHEKAISHHMQALETMESGPIARAYGAMNWCEVGFCALKTGKLDDARGLFDKGLTMPTGPMLLMKPQLHVGAALVALQQGRPADARDHATKAREFAEAKQMRHTFPLLELVDGYVAAVEGDTPKALEHFGMAENMAEGGGMLPMLWQVCCEQAKLLDAAGQPDEAEAKRKKGRAAVDEIAGRFKDPQLRDDYVANATAQLAPPS